MAPFEDIKINYSHGWDDSVGDPNALALLLNLCYVDLLDVMDVLDVSATARTAEVVCGELEHSQFLTFGDVSRDTTSSS